MLSKEDKEILKSAVAILKNEASEIAPKKVGEKAKIALNGFGTFKLERKAASTARNPATGGEVQVPEKTTFKFTASKSFTQEL